MATVTGKPIDIGQGWPVAEDVDKAMAAGSSIVSIYAIPGASGRTPQVFDFNPGIIQQPVHGLSVSIDDSLNVTITGQSNAAEYVTMIVNGKVYSRTSVVPEAAAVVAAALVVLVQADLPGTSSSAGIISFVGAYSVTVRVGAPAIAGRKIYRQTDQIQVVVWSPSPSDRTLIARSIDVALKRQQRIMLPDTSTAIINYQGSRLSDKEENTGIYRRDLIYTALYETIDEYDVYEITSVQITSSAPAFNATI